MLCCGHASPSLLFDDCINPVVDLSCGCHCASHYVCVCHMVSEDNGCLSGTSSRSIANLSLWRHWPALSHSSAPARSRSPVPCCCCSRSVSVVCPVLSSVCLMSSPSSLSCSNLQPPPPPLPRSFLNEQLSQDVTEMLLVVQREVEEDGTWLNADDSRK